jgi:hypothetical protein
MYKMLISHIFTSDRTKHAACMCRPVFKKKKAAYNQTINFPGYTCCAV